MTPMPAPTAARAPRPSWPRPSAPASAGSGRRALGKSFPHLERPTRNNNPPNNASSGRPGDSVTRCNDRHEEDNHLLDLRPHVAGVAVPGAELLLRQVPRASSPGQGLQKPQACLPRQVLTPFPRKLNRRTPPHRRHTPIKTASESAQEDAEGCQSPSGHLPQYLRNEENPGNRPLRRKWRSPRPGPLVGRITLSAMATGTITTDTKA